MSDNQTTTTESRPACHLQAAAGRVEDCPEQECAFWDDQKCVIAALRADYEHDPGLTQMLLALRERLSAATPKRWPPLHLLTTEDRKVD
jgi:hypothetical protein